MHGTPWNIFLDLPPNNRTSPDSSSILSAFAASLSTPYKNSAESPREKETTVRGFCSHPHTYRKVFSQNHIQQVSSYRKNFRYLQKLLLLLVQQLEEERLVCHCSFHSRSPDWQFFRT
ncbi:hypothetical protein ACMD2_17786, partial [Ananas comosus]